MNKLIVGLFLLVMSVGAAANSVNTNGLSEQQILQLQLEASKLRDARNTDISAEKISEYTLVGQQVSQAIITVASELGKSVDDVLSTTTGKIIIFIVVWKVIGEDLMGFIVAGLWCLTFIPLWAYYFRKFCINYEFSYHENGKVSEKRRRGCSSDVAAIFIIAAIAIVIVPMFMAFG